MDFTSFSEVVKIEIATQIHTISFCFYFYYVPVSMQLIPGKDRVFGCFANAVQNLLLSPKKVLSGIIQGTSDLRRL